MPGKQIEMPRSPQNSDTATTANSPAQAVVHHGRSGPSVVLDAIRGSAAVIVLFNHVRAAFFVDYKDLLHKNLLVKLLYFVAGLGHEAVIVFFILSGYLISSSVFRSIKSKRWSWEHYALNRLTRLYVVLVPALLLAAFWDRLGLSLFPHASVYISAPYFKTLIKEPIAHVATWPIWLGNLLFVQKILVPPFGSNAALWSLSFEFWYYVLFPLFLLGLCLPQMPTRPRVLYTVAGVLGLCFVGKEIALYFLIWLMGTAISAAPPARRTPSRLYLLVSAVAFVGTLAVSRFHIIHSQETADFVTGIAFAALMYGIVNQGTKPANPGNEYFRRAAVFLSGISYSLYLVHLPLLIFCSGFLIGPGMPWQPDMRHLLIGVLLATGTLGYACLVWWLAESRTDKVRKWFGDRLIKSV